MEEKNRTQNTKEEKIYTESIVEPKREMVLTPKNDVIFQSLFSKGHENITKALISSIIKTEITEIYMDTSTHLTRKYMDSKLGVLDLQVKLQDGIQCNVEVQLKDKGDTEDRFVWYTSSQFVSQLKKGEKYKELKKTIGIIILNYELPKLKDIEEGCTNWKWIETKYHEKILTDKMEIYIIELPKIIHKGILKLEDSLTQWMLFLDNPNSEEVKKIMEDNKEIKEAVETFDDITSDEELRRVAELRQKAIWDENNMIATAEERGEQKGRQEEKKEIAKKLIEKGMLIEQVEEITGLTKEEIEN